MGCLIFIEQVHSNVAYDDFEKRSERRKRRKKRGYEITEMTNANIWQTQNMLSYTSTQFH